MKRILLVLICILGIFSIGCSSEDTKEEAKTFAITDGQTYDDIETVEGGYIIPTGKWEVTKLEDSTVMNKITLSSDKNGNKDIMYDKTFTLEVEEDETLILMMAGDNMQLHFEEIQD